MTGGRLWLSCLAAAVVAGVATAEDLRPGFRWRQGLAGEFEPGALYRMAVPAEVFDGCASFPSDLRILDESGQQWPFFLRIPAGSEVVQTVSAQVLNVALVDAPERMLRQDLRIAPDPASGKPREHNQVTLHTPGRDFIRRVEIYGREEHSEWGFLGAGYLVDHSRDALASNRTIHYPVSTLPWLQVRLFPNARGAAESPSCDQLAAGRVVTRAGEVEPVPLNARKFPDAGVARTSQVLGFDVGGRNRPLERLIIRAAEREYARPVRVSGRDDDAAEWRWLADGEIHRIGGDAQESVSLNGAACRFLKLEIFHYDDHPLTGVQVAAEAVPRWLIFEAGSGRKPALYYGGVVNPPRYDLERRKAADPDPATLPVKLDARSENPGYRSVAEGRPWLAFVAVGLVSLLVMWVILGMLRQQIKDPAG